MSYLEWLAMIAMPDEKQRSEYWEVLDRLHKTRFVALVKGDQNRAKDGESLRMDYEDFTGESCDIFGECSVLEMMVALAIRCENQIMYDPDEGDRTHVWFWEMFSNLGLDAFSENWFDDLEFCDTLSRFLGRKYDTDGYGGLFYIPNFEGDMRKIELWYQLGYYIESKFL